MDEITIRKALPKDLDAISAIKLSSWQNPASLFGGKNGILS